MTTRSTGKKATSTKDASDAEHKTAIKRQKQQNRVDKGTAKNKKMEAKADKEKAHAQIMAKTGFKHGMGFWNKNEKPKAKTNSKKNTGKGSKGGFFRRNKK
jgi:hypothetical protein